MLSAEPSQGDDAQGAQDPTRTATSRWRGWLRAPKAAVVTVFGVALTAWLFPALTRQWDDRQKEHELKAAVVSDMASATAHALVGGEAIWSGHALTKQEQQEKRRIGDQWALSALEIEARIRTYFPSSVVASWLVYSWAVDRFIDARHVSASAALQDAVNRRVTLDPRVSDAAALLLVRGESTDGPAPWFGVYRRSPTRSTDRDSLRRLHRMLAPQIKRYRDGPLVISTWTALERSLLSFEQAVADEILGSHATGYSTTLSDLSRDLLP